MVYRYYERERMMTMNICMKLRKIYAEVWAKEEKENNFLIYARTEKETSEHVVAEISASGVSYLNKSAEVDMLVNEMLFMIMRGH